MIRIHCSSGAPCQPSVADLADWTPPGDAIWIDLLKGRGSE
jgi:hypothetical protein